MEFVQPIRDKGRIEAMKKLLKASNMRDYVLFVLGINSGLRISDLLGLTVGDVTAKGKKAPSISDRISLKETKTGKTKSFPLGDTSKKAIKDYLSSRGLDCNDPHQRSLPLFPSRKRADGGCRPISRIQAYRILNDVAKVVGIEERIGTHTLRKTFAYHAYQNGYDLSMIQKLLNHSSPGVTLRYIGITQDEMDNVYLSLNL